MYIRCILAILAAMAISGDRADVNRYRTPVLPDAPDIRSLPSSVRSIDVIDPGVFVSVEQQANNKQNPLQPQSRLEIIRYVSGEFAKPVSPIPGGRKGFRIPVGEKLNQAELRSALRHEGAAVNVGETVQVTSVEFRAKEIVVQVNGGGKKHFNLREHLQVGVGGSQVPGTGQSGPQEKPGATLILDYGRPVPDLSADDVMTALQMFLSFSKEQSAAVNWVDTCPRNSKMPSRIRRRWWAWITKWCSRPWDVRITKFASAIRTAARQKTGFTGILLPGLFSSRSTETR